MKTILSCVFSAAALSTLADLTVTGVTADAERRQVVVEYTLSGETPQIVTAEFFEDGVALPAELTANAVGDVNRLVQPTADDEVRKIYWMTDALADAKPALGKISVRLSAWTKENPPDYMVYDFVATNSVRYYVSTNALPGGLGNLAYRKEKMVFRRIPAAGVEWYMGSPDGENGRNETEGRENRHLVLLTHDYYMAVFETTYGQAPYVFAGSYYSIRIVDNSLEKNGDPSYALGNVTYGYLKGASTDNPSSSLAIGALRARTGIDFDLPTEAQWEFACRAGTEAAMNSNKNLGDGDGNLINPASMRELGWIYYNNSNAEDGKTYGPRPVGQKIPNAWGLYDMHGNVAELCRDMAFGEFVASDEAVENPIATSYDDTKGHVLRGGYYNQSASNCRSAYRGYEGKAGAYLGYGFRLIAPIPLN